MKSNLVIIILWGSLGILLVGYLVNNYIQFQRQKYAIVKRTINGKIISMHDRKRGTFDLKVNNENKEELVLSLEISWFLKENSIKVGDSLTKVSDSPSIQFFKMKGSNNYEICCEYEIHTL